MQEVASLRTLRSRTPNSTLTFCTQWAAAYHACTTAATRAVLPELPVTDPPLRSCSQAWSAQAVSGLHPHFEPRPHARCVLSAQTYTLQQLLTLSGACTECASWVVRDGDQTQNAQQCMQPGPSSLRACGCACAHRGTAVVLCLPSCLTCVPDRTLHDATPVRLCSCAAPQQLSTHR